MYRPFACTLFALAGLSMLRAQAPHPLPQGSPAPPSAEPQRPPRAAPRESGRGRGATAERQTAPSGSAGAAAAPPASSAQAYPAPPAEEHVVTTEHSMTVNGRAIPYTAHAGTLVLKREDGRPLASIFFVAYTRDDQKNNRAWPITFAFNGGPGSSSVWLHMGVLGPKRVAMGNAQGEQPAPPYRLVDNESTILSISDVVFIDPVSTGFSRPAPGESPSQFHGVEGDIQSVGEFIRLYLTRYERWASPKFLAGESYGTTRAAGLSLELLNNGIYLNGITLLSSVLNFQTISFAPGNDLPYVLFLPTYTAVAWYHHKLGPDLKDFKKAIAAAREFAGGDYAAALLKGTGISPEERTRVATKMARLTGLPEKFIELSNLRVTMGRFGEELLRDERKVIGRYDGRIVGFDLDAEASQPDYDPSYSAVQGVYTAMFNDYVHRDLNYSTDIPYEVLTGKVRPWNWGRAENQYLDTADRMRQALAQNPAMHVLFGAGYYDLATPFFGAEYTVNHLELTPALRDHVGMYYCDAGHMLYMKTACLDSFHAAMGGMYKAAAGPEANTTGTAKVPTP